jgi:multimeric flavodoxin WrbA
MGEILGLSAGATDGSAEILLATALETARRAGAGVHLVRLADLRLPLEEGGDDADLWWLW